MREMKRIKTITMVNEHGDKIVINHDDTKTRESYAERGFEIEQAEQPAPESNTVTSESNDPDSQPEAKNDPEVTKDTDKLPEANAEPEVGAEVEAAISGPSIQDMKAFLKEKGVPISGNLGEKKVKALYESNGGK